MYPFSSFIFYVIYIALILPIFPKASLAITFTLVNRCDNTVWPGILSNSGSSGFCTTGFQLTPHATRTLQAEPGWSGRFWGRTGCSFDPITGQGNCATGDCGSNQIECNGAGAAPPATLAEFTLGSGGGQDFYDVSLVDGYNLPMIIETGGGSGACGLTGCMADLNRVCPSELRAGDGQGCRSACGAFGSPEYCCSGAYGSPVTCQPSIYSEMFKNACPRSYSYAYDDATSTFTCSGANYKITFCPSRTSQKSSMDSTSAPVTTGVTPAGSDFPSWLPSFLTAGTSDIMMQSHIIICSTTTFVALLLLQL